MKRRDLTSSERKDLRGETAAGMLKGAISGLTAGAGAGAVGGVPGAIIGGAIGLTVGAIGGGAMARREEKAAVETARASQSAKKAQTEAIHRAQEFEREAQSAGAKGQKGMPAKPFVSDDATLVQATDIGGGTAYDRWYRQNFTA